MFESLTNLTKAAVGVVLTPVALVVDIVTLPASSMDIDRGPFDRTAELVDNIGSLVKAALKEEKG